MQITSGDLITFLSHLVPGYVVYVMLFLFVFYSFAAANAGVLYVYFTSYQKVDEEDFGGPWELTKEGFMTSFALFLVSISAND